MTNIIINVNDAELEEARIYAAEEGIRISALVKQAIRDYNTMHRKRLQAEKAMAALDAIRGKVKFDHIPTRDELNAR